MCFAFSTDDAAGLRSREGRASRDADVDVDDELEEEEGGLLLLSDDDE